MLKNILIILFAMIGLDAMAYGPWIFGNNNISVQVPFTQKASIGTDQASTIPMLTIARQRGVATPVAGTTLHISGLDSTVNGLQIDAYGSSPTIVLRQSNGSQASPTASTTSNSLGSLGFRGYGSTTYSGTRAQILSFPTETWTDSAQGADLRILTSLTGAATASTRLYIDGTGSIAIGQGSTAAEITALMELDSTTKGFLTPRMNTTQKNAISSPATGLEVFDTTTSKKNIYTGSAWFENVISATDGVIIRTQPAQTSKSGAVTLTAAELRTQIIEYTGAVANLQLPTGTDLQTSIGSATNVAFDFSVINTGSGAATLTTNTGLTLTGSMVVTNGTSGTFRARRNGANTFTIYRLN